MNVADDVCEDGENNNVDELATQRKQDKGRRSARMQAKLVMATKMASCVTGQVRYFRTIWMCLV